MYRLQIDAVGFLCDTTTECSCNLEGLNVRYEEAYDANNAQCFLTEMPENKDLMSELDYAVLATTNDVNHGFQQEEFQDMVIEYLGCQMRVHKINETQFIILAPDRSVRRIAKEILLEKMTFQLSMTEFALDVWKPQNMSVVERLHEKVSVTVNQIPPHLCISKILSFILSPYCAMDNTNTAAETLITSEKFTCTAWTDSALKIPERIMAALFVRAPDAEQMEEANDSTDLRITQLIVDRTIVGGHQMNYKIHGRVEDAKKRILDAPVRKEAMSSVCDHSSTTNDYCYKSGPLFCTPPILDHGCTDALKLYCDVMLSDTITELLSLSM